MQRTERHAWGLEVRAARTRRLLGAVLAACAWFGAAGGMRAEDAPAEIERFVLFRDGTLLKLAMPDAEVAIERLNDAGAVEPSKKKLSELGDIRLVAQPRLEDLAAFRAGVRELSSEEFGTRESAFQKLKNLAPRVRAELLAAFNASDDPEARARLGQILRALPATDAEPLTDAITEGGAAAPVSLGNWTLAAHSGETRVELTRARVLQLLSAAPKEDELAAPAIAMAHVSERIQNDGDENFGAERTRIDFEQAPDGTALTAGMDVSRTFVPKGVTITTSLQGSIVSVNDYNVQGRSGGMSCATHQPIWEGSLTIRFCMPGRPGVPAGVTRAGLWIAAVMADGTSLEAYDAKGTRIAEIKTTRGPNEFLGVRSRVPIAYLKVVPNLNIDPNYTIDDLVFDAPRPLDAFGHPDLTSVRLPGGERVLCRAARIKDGTLTMEGLSIGAEKLARPFAPGTRVLTALKDQKDPAPPKGCWVRTADGSTLRAASEDGLYCQRAPKLTLSNANVCVLWSDAKGYREMDAAKLSPAGTADSAAFSLSDEGEKKGPLAFKAATFEKELVLRGGDEQVRFAYENAPCVWLHPARALPAGAGRAMLSGVEVLALKGNANQDGAFEFVSFGPEGLLVKQGTYQVHVGIEEVSGVVAP